MTVEDLTDSLDLFVDGDNVTFEGSLKSITDPWTEYDKSNNTGHFVPIQLPAICKGKEVTLKGRTGGDRKVMVDDDLFLVIRLENLSGTTMTVEMDDAELMKLDFTALIPTGEAAYDATKTDFGRFGKRDEITEGFAIKWDGTKATVTGTLKKITAELHEKYEKLVVNKHYVPIGMSGWYFDGVPKQVGMDGSNLKSNPDKDFVFSVTEEDKTKLRKIVYNGETVVEIDLSGVTVEP